MFQKALLEDLKKFLFILKPIYFDGKKTRKNFKKI